MFKMEVCTRSTSARAKQPCVPCRKYERVTPAHCILRQSKGKISRIPFLFRWSLGARSDATHTYDEMTLIAFNPSFPSRSQWLSNPSLDL